MDRSPRHLFRPVSPASRRPSDPDALRAQLALDHLDLVRRVAATLHARCRQHVELDELVALGNVGLAEAAARFDPGAGVPFRTFAYYRVQGAIVDGLRRMTALPVREWRRLVALRAASDHLERCAADGGGADGTAGTLAALRTALAEVRTVYLTSLACLDDSETPSIEPDVAERIDQARLSSVVPAALASLPERERLLVQKHYWEGKTLVAAGAELGISRSVACRLHARAVARLQRWYGRGVAAAAGGA